jgi:hypothetical protein
MPRLVDGRQQDGMLHPEANDSQTGKQALWRSDMSSMWMLCCASATDVAALSPVIRRRSVTTAFKKTACVASPNANDPASVRPAERLRCGQHGLCTGGVSTVQTHSRGRPTWGRTIACATPKLRSRTSGEQRGCFSCRGFLVPG